MHRLIENKFSHTDLSPPSACFKTIQLFISAAKYNGFVNFSCHHYMVMFASYAVIFPSS